MWKTQEASRMKTTHAQVKAMSCIPGRHLVDPGGLYLLVLGPAKSYFTYRYTLRGKTREMSLGRFPLVTLAKARAEHLKLQTQVVADKTDALAIRRARAAASHEASVFRVPTFGEAADGLLRAKSREWRHPVHVHAWVMNLTAHCAPIRNLPVDQVDSAAVLKVLTPMWTKTPETASRLRGRIEAVLDAAKAHKWIDENRANPARWKGGLKHLLPNPKKLGDRRHFSAMPYADVPAYMEKLRAAQGVMYRALEFTILTAARTAEVLRAAWEEVDVDAALWKLPENRTKAGREHRVPLSTAAQEILREQLKERGDNRYLFPGHVAHRALAINCMVHAMARTGAGGFTVHGFRSAFGIGLAT
jgi:integrase